MNKDKEDKLVAKYAYMFSEKQPSTERMLKHIELSEKICNARDTNNSGLIASLQEEKTKVEPFYPIAFGLECNDGWYDLLDELMGKIQELDKDKIVLVHQVKEKFGGLRFDISSGTDIIFNIIHDYEDKSYNICEVCGKLGKLCTTGHWLKTVCKEHRISKTWSDLDQEYKPVCHFHKGEELIVNNMYFAKVADMYFDKEEDTWIITMNDKTSWSQESNHLKRKTYNKLYIGWIVKHEGYPSREFLITDAHCATSGWYYDLVSGTLTVLGCEEARLKAVRDKNGYVKTAEVPNPPTNSEEDA